MGKFLSFFCVVLLSWAGTVNAQRMCGMEAMKAALTKQNPAFAAHLEKVRAEQIQLTQQYESQSMAKTMQRTTQDITIPVVFHIILTQVQIDQLGGETGIGARIASQIDALNRDFNAQNADYIKIPSVFQSLYGNMGIHFGLAHRTSAGTSTAGYEIKVTTLPGFAPGANEGFSDAKHTSTGGLDAWDVDKYINIWIIAPQSGNLVGTTVPRSFTDPQANPPQYLMPANEIGITAHYGAFGVQANTTEYYYKTFTGGRTITHEMGHYFELWHTWGDDGGLCPTNGGTDDDVADTPPQGDYDYDCPSFPHTDACSPSSPGTMFMNFMNYVDDSCMLMFSKGQVTRARANIAQDGESYSLTQNSDLLYWPTAVSSIATQSDFAVVPNPTTGLVKIVFNNAQQLQGINIVNVTGQTITQIITNNNNTYTVDLSGMSKGVYFVQCRFDGGIVTRKIILQ